MDGSDAKDPREHVIPDTHGHAKGEHKPYAEERPIPYSARMLFLWFYHACRRGFPRFLMVADHINYLTFEDPSAVNLVRRALKLAEAGDLYGAAQTAGVEVGHASVVSEGLRRGMRYSIGAEVDNDPRSRPDAQNIVEAMRPDAMIRAVHFLTIDHPVLGAAWAWPFDNPDFKDVYEHVGTERTWELYVETLLDAIEKQPGHIVAHFYVPAKFGHWPDDATLEGYEDRLVEACAARSMAIEVNARYFYRYFENDEENRARYRAANLRLLRKAKERGVPISVGSDAHSPKDQAGGFSEVLALLDEAGINEIAFPINGRLARVALRATDELLRQRQSAPPAPVPAGSSVSGMTRAEITASRNGSPPDDEDAGADEAQPVPARKPAKKKAPPKRTVPADAVAPGAAVAAAPAEEPAADVPAAEGDAAPAAAAPPRKRVRPPKRTPVPHAAEADAAAVASETVASEIVATETVASEAVTPEPAVSETVASEAVASEGVADRAPDVAEPAPAARVRVVRTKVPPAPAGEPPSKRKPAPKAAAAKKPAAKRPAAARATPARTAGTAKKAAPTKKRVTKPAKAGPKARPAKPAAKRPAARAAKKKVRVSPKPPARKKVAGKTARAVKRAVAKRPVAKKTAGKKSVPKRGPRASVKSKPSKSRR